MPNPIETIRELHPLPEEARRARWAEGAEAWRALGNPEQALRWTRLGGDPAAIETAEAAWATERARQERILAANASAASTRGAPPALPSLAWNEAEDLAGGISWTVSDGRVCLIDLRNGRVQHIPLKPSGGIENRLRAMAEKGEPFLVAALTLPPLLMLALEAQPRQILGKQTAVFLVEPCLGVFRMLARLFDLAKPLGADHLLWLVGEDWTHQLASLLKTYPSLPVPDPADVVDAGPAGAQAAEVLREANRWRLQDTERLLIDLYSFYAARPPTAWRKAFEEGAAPRVFLLTTRFSSVLQYVSRDLEQAFRSLGCTATVFIERRDCERGTLYALIKAIHAFRPDLVVQIDHLRPETQGAIPATLPFACWIQDRLPNLFQEKWIKALGPRDLTFAMWPTIAKDCLAAGYPEVHPLPVAGNAFVYRHPEHPPATGPDIAFVSNIQGPRRLLDYPGLVEEAARILCVEGIGYRDPAFYARLLARIEKGLRQKIPEQDRPGVLHYLSFDVERYVQRTEPLRWARAMGLAVAVYGQGWQEIPEFASIARGIVQPGEALRDLYASAKIHLHMNSDTNVHARVFECLLSGGFILAWAHPGDREPGGLGEMLGIGREVVTFRNRVDFENQVRRYLADAGERRTVSAAGRARVLKQHTTVHRAREMLARVRERLKADSPPETHAPLETLATLHGLGEEARRARWAEGAALWGALGNPEQALRWARLGGDPAAIRAAEAAWASERAAQETTMRRNAASAERRLSPPALPSLAWNEAKDLARSITWMRRDGRVDLVDLSGKVPVPIPLSAPVQVEEGLRTLAASGHPFLFGPLGHPRLLDLILQAQPSPFLTMKAALFLVEPRPGVFRMLARLFDLSNPLAADHVLWFVGEDWTERLSSFLRAAPGIPVPAQKAILGRGLDPEAAGALLAEATAWREAELARLDASNDRLFTHRTDAEWRDAFAPEAKPRVLFITSRFTTVLQYVVRDLDQAFRTLGCPTTTVIEDRDCVWSIAMQLRQKIAAFKPDLVIQLDHLRPELGTAIPASIPVACWVQDWLPNLFDHAAIQRLGPRDLNFMMWDGIARECLAAGYPHAKLLLAGANAFLYRKPPGTGPRASGVAMVANVSQPGDLAKYPGLTRAAEEILRAEGIGYGDPAFYRALLVRLEDTLGLRVEEPDRHQVVWHLSFDVERYVERTEPLRWAIAMGLDLRLYGKGWESSPEFRPYARGPVPSGEPLRDVYASAKIHLHMNKYTNVHPRVLECILSGGFVLPWARPSDTRPGGLGEALEIGKEIVTYADRADFEEKLRRYLADDEARQAVSEAGHRRVLSEHTTVHRAREILAWARARLERP